ncbi:MAG: formate--tetrahydrofolate ligase [Kiritimatiellaeota bacterium]|nr:formate--tetrahydrofolate ligase [Kiritimatiellota bacterium]
MKLDPTTMPDWQIAAIAEQNLRPISDVATDAGLRPNEWFAVDRNLARVDLHAVNQRLGDAPQRAKYINVTAINPTPLGEGKTTTTLGLIQGLAKLGRRPIGTLRQPSGGPTFNIKGSAAGGGLAQVLPIAPLSLGLTGDIDAVTNANNLAMTALNARMQHERNYDDARLAKSGLTRLAIDPATVQIRWAMDFCAQCLRAITIGKGGSQDGFETDSGFYISVASEVMAVLAMARDLADLRLRLGKIICAYSTSGKPVTTADLEVDGAMAAWLLRSVNPTLMQTLEGQPVLVHAGPFANIAIGQSSVISDLIGAKLADYLVTESGFGADIGFQKFCDIKCRATGLAPNAAVLVATVRALKAHGGGPAIKPGAKLDAVYTSENLALLEKGCENLLAHIGILKDAGVPPVVSISVFPTDTPAEHALIRRVAEAAGARCAVSNHWLKGGDGALELANAVMDAANEPTQFKLSDLSAPLSKRIADIVVKVYGGDGVDYTPEARAKLAALEANPDTARLPVCMAKTQYSFSDDAALLGAPEGFTVTVRNLKISAGAGFIVALTGEIMTMPGLPKVPSAENIDVDDMGRISGLF